MEPAEQTQLTTAFNEDEWLKLIFLLSDTQKWLNSMVTSAMFALPMKERRKLMRKSYRLTIESLAHIMERHLFRIPRHPGAGKFHISTVQVLGLIRDAYNVPSVSIAGTANFKREVDTGMIVGYDCNQVATAVITILTDAAGRILTAFPGKLREQTSVANL